MNGKEYSPDLDLNCWLWHIPVRRAIIVLFVHFYLCRKRQFQLRKYSHYASNFLPKKVVVTGIGLVTCLGVGKDYVWNKLIQGHCGITKVKGQGQLHVTLQLNLFISEYKNYWRTFIYILHSHRFGFYPHTHFYVPNFI